MQELLVSYAVFVWWASVHPGELLFISKHLRELRDTVDPLKRWALIVKVGDCLLRMKSRHLQAMLEHERDEDNMQETLELASKREQRVLSEVNAPIDTGATVTREVRDRQWLHDLHQDVNRFALFVVKDPVWPPVPDNDEQTSPIPAGNDDPTDIEPGE